MFGGRFGLIRFSLRDETPTEVEVKALFVERVRSLVSVGGNALAGHEFREHHGASVTATRGISVSHDFRESVSAVSGIVRNYPVCLNLSENIQSASWLSGNIRLRHTFTEGISADVFIAQNTPVSHLFAENISSGAILGKDFKFTQEFRESVFALTMATLLEELSFTISVSLKPGEELRVDSELFTVTLNGQNVIHLHNGDFINLDRSVVNLQINGSPSGKLIYQERYL